MSDQFWLTKAQLKRVEPFSRGRVAFRASMRSASTKKSWPRNGRLHHSMSATFSRISMSQV